MEYNIYSDISSRTHGDIYIGVIGPVRTGKSTFITKFMEKMVVPYVTDDNVKERMIDELPQSANGKNIMTTQPKFVPNVAVEVTPYENCTAKFRLVDCVGYLVDGANGHMDGEKERMVKTPWQEEEMSFEQAADLGTRKVIEEHSTVGVVMTTDGTITTDLPRNAYVKAEERVVKELKTLGKPFVIILNSTVPTSPQTQKLAEELQEKYGSKVMPMDVLNMSDEDISHLFENLLYEFPLVDVEVKTGKWLQALPLENTLINGLITEISKAGEGLEKMADYVVFGKMFREDERFLPPQTEMIDLGHGKIVLKIDARPELFYKAISEECDMEIEDEFSLISMLKEFSTAKRQYDKLKDALENVKATGYGVVMPSLEDMTLNEPEIVKQGGRYGVKLKATAPSLHIMQVDIESEVSPIVGTEQQSEELVKNLLSEFETNPQGLWETNIFGKSLHMMVNEGLANKLTAMPEDTQKKMRRTLSRIVNEGKGGIICILL